MDTCNDMDVDKVGVKIYLNTYLGFITVPHQMAFPGSCKVLGHTFITKGGKNGQEISLLYTSGFYLATNVNQKSRACQPSYTKTGFQ